MKPKRGFALCALLALFSGACSKGPKLEVPSPFFEFGTLILGETTNHEFIFSNSGDEDLLIQGIQSSCGCTATQIWVDLPDGTVRRGEPKPSGDVLLVHPGEKGKVEIVVNTKGFQANASERTGTISLRTNDKETPYTMLSFLIRVQQPYWLEKDRFDLGRIGRREAKVFHTPLRAMEGKQFHITQIRTNHPALKAQTFEEREDKSFFQVEISAGPGLPVGAFNGKVELVTDIRGGYTIEIPVIGYILPDIALSPELFQFPWITKGKEESVRLEAVFTDPSRKLKLGNVEIEGTGKEFLELHVAESEEGKKFQLTLKSSSGMNVASFRGNVKIQTDDPEWPTLVIPYRGFVK